MLRLRLRSHAHILLSSIMVFSIVGAAIGLTSAPVTASVPCNGGTNDFDGDGLADLAIADARASVSGLANAGRVHVMYGDGATQTITQDHESLGGFAAEAGDQFGFAVTALDWNRDACGDLAISAPDEALGDKQRAGAVLVLLGSPEGLGQKPAIDFLATDAAFAGVDPAGDRLGYSLAGGKTAAGESYLLFGAPGRELKTAAGVLNEAGAVGYARGTQRALTHQDSPGVFGTAEAGDLFGYSVAAGKRHIAVGGFGEEVGGQNSSGTVVVLDHGISQGALTGVAGTDQAGTGQTGLPEDSDWYGRSIAVTDYLDDSGDPASLLVIGVPGEDISSNPDAGRVVSVSIDGDLTELADVSQDVPGVEDANETGDYFGWAVTATNRRPNSVPTWQDLVFAVGSPGESIGDMDGSGSVQVFSAIGEPGTHDVVVSDSHLAGAGFTRQPEQSLGRFIHSTPTHLFISDPRGAEPAVYGIPWDNLLAGGTGEVRVYKPGQAGLPTEDVGLFGAALA